MQKVVINENQRGFLFRKGRFAGLLEPGTYRFFGADAQVEMSFLDQNLRSDRCALDTLLSCPEIAKQTAVADVPDQHLALHFVNGKFQNVLRQGRCAFWSVFDRHEFQLVDISSPVVDESVSRYIFSYIPAMFYTRVDVSPYQKARLYFNKQSTSEIFFFPPSPRQIVADRASSSEAPPSCAPWPPFFLASTSLLRYSFTSSLSSRPGVFRSIF